MLTMTDPDPAEDWTTELAGLLDRLITQDLRWNVVAVPGTVTLTRGWEDGAVDTVVISGPQSAYATRVDAGEREVWSSTGTADEVVDTVEKLPAPSDPDTPDGSDHTPLPTGQWT